MPGRIQEADRARLAVNTRLEAPCGERHRAGIGRDPERGRRAFCDQDRDALRREHTVRAVADADDVRGQGLEPELIMAEREDYPVGLFLHGLHRLGLGVLAEREGTRRNGDTSANILDCSLCSF